MLQDDHNCLAATFSSTRDLQGSGEVSIGAGEISILWSTRGRKMYLQTCKASVPLSAAMPKSVGFLDFTDLTTIFNVMMIVLNILASARRSGLLAADGFAAS